MSKTVGDELKCRERERLFEREDGIWGKGVCEEKVNMLCNTVFLRKWSFRLFSFFVERKSVLSE